MELTTSTSTSTARPAPEHEAQRLASTLYSLLFVAPPKRAATMTQSGPDKYRDVKRHILSIEDIRDHLAARRTWATTLTNKDGMTRAGCRDYDAGGKQLLLDGLASAASDGITAFAIYLPATSDNEATKATNDGGHVWTLYKRPAPAKDVKAQLAALPGAKGEIYPSGNCVRLPFGLHRRKGTRGILLLQDGREFILDEPRERVAGLRAVLALSLNSAPPEAKASTSTSGGAFGESYDPQAWEGITKTYGALLMNSSRYKFFFREFSQLATLARGERVVLYRDGAPDDSGSAQVAALVWNLINARRKDAARGDGAPPESEIRAVALHWKDALRDNRNDAHYRAQIDYEINRYRPVTYQPSATTSLAGAPAAQPSTLPAPKTRSRGRPVGSQGAQRLARLDALCDLLIVDTVVTCGGLARATNVSTRQIGDDLKTLQAAGRVELKRARYGYSVLRSEGKIPADQIGNYAPFDASARHAMCMGDTPRGGFASGAAVAADEQVSPRSDVISAEPMPASDPVQFDEREAVSADDQGGTGAAGVSPKTAAPILPRLTLAQLVADAFDSVIGRKVTERYILRYVAMNADGRTFTTKAIKALITQERKRRAWERAEQQLAAKVREMSQSELARRAKASASALAKAERAAVRTPEPDTMAYQSARRTADPAIAFDQAKANKRKPTPISVLRRDAGIYAAEEARRAALIETEREYLMQLALDALDEQRPAAPEPVAPLFGRSIRELAANGSRHYQNVRSA